MFDILSRKESCLIIDKLNHKVVYNIAFEYKENLINVDGSENDFGMYGGAGFQSGPFDFKARLHFPDTSETDFMFIGASISYLFLNLM